MKDLYQWRSDFFFHPMILFIVDVKFRLKKERSGSRYTDLHIY